ncbi:MAG: NADH-quinone oxidoreductase subunit J [Pseudomonadota bacterium]|nr:NADH-quinone oxidoreductase subunit J [Pseudomonadota bacterium]
METAIFWGLSFCAVAAALAVVFLRQAVNGVMSLLALMLVMAGLYLLLGAQLVALFQLIVYAGAVLVLFVLVVMLLNLERKPARPLLYPGKPAVASLLALCGAGFAAILRWAPPPGGGPMGGAVKPAPPIEQLAIDLFTERLLIFELTSVLLLAAAVGAIVMSRKAGDLS